VVVESDPNSKFPVGSRVFGCTEGFQLYSREGCYSEYFTAPENQLAFVPANIPLSDAGALPLVCLTAWQALEAAALSPGDRLLIHAGAGGVGSVAIQIAKSRGLHVTTTCSTRNVDFCIQELGADVAIDYTTQKFEEVCKDQPFDAIIDLIGGSVEVRSMKVLKKSGTLVMVLNSGWIKERGFGLAPLFIMYHLAKNKLFGALRLGPKYKVILVSPNGEQMAEIAKLLESGKLKVVIDRKLPLEEAVEAHKYMEQGHARGKVVLVVNPELQ
jgi:NADPH:quinone reductase-like Zn-dependent oxidoreductase